MTQDTRSKVLIVDDVKSNHYVIDHILKDLDVVTVHAMSGEAALELLYDHDFAVVLMDVVMPGLSGYETVTEIQKNPRLKKVPVVIITASIGNSDMATQAYNVGAVDYMTKPLEPVGIINKVRQFVELDQQRRLAESAQHKAEALSSRLDILLASAGEGILGLDLEGSISFANPKACRLLGTSEEQLLKSKLSDYVSAENQDLIQSLSSYCSVNNEGETWTTRTGKNIIVEYSCELARNTEGRVMGAVVMFQDISERKEAERKLRYLANYDPLTDLANRAYFYDALARSIALCRRSGSRLAVLFVDLDHFKYINDQYGHDAGDLLLRKVSGILRGALREDDLVARMGGDEFAVVLHNINDDKDVCIVAEKILSEMIVPLDLGCAKVHIGASIGIATFDDPSMDVDALLKAADAAMYEVKAEGRNSYQFFASRMRKKIEQKQSIQLMLQQALHSDEFSVVYQPKISLSQKKMVGFEALLRWQPNQGASISPAVFIPIAEDTGQIVELGEWVLVQVFEQISKWKNLPGFEGMTVAINVSRRQLCSEQFQRTLTQSLQDYNVRPECIDLEITETAMSGDQAMVIVELEKIRALGIKLSLDDFGTGHASVDCLRKLPIDNLKIDRSFIKDIGIDGRDEELIRVVLAMAKVMSIDVVAEGVETEQQLSFLAEQNVDTIQGFYFSKPLTLDAITESIRLYGMDYSDGFDKLTTFIERQASLDEEMSVCRMGPKPGALPPQIM